jgi:hypothetical protein
VIDHRRILARVPAINAPIVAADGTASRYGIGSRRPHAVMASQQGDMLQTD